MLLSFGACVAGFKIFKGPPGTKVFRAQLGAIAYSFQKFSLSWFEQNEAPQHMEDVHEFCGVLC